MDWNTETKEGRSRFSEVLEEKQSTWKRIRLIVAVWPDGKAIRSRKMDGKDSIELARVDRRQVGSLVGSLERLGVFRQPLSETRHTYVDVGYGVIEVNYGTYMLHMESWEQHPDPKQGNAGFGRFCAVWNCLVQWIEQAKSDLEKAHKPTRSPVKGSVLKF